MTMRVFAFFDYFVSQEREDANPREDAWRDEINKA